MKPPYNRWSYLNMRMFYPTVGIPSADEPYILKKSIDKGITEVKVSQPDPSGKPNGKSAGKYIPTELIFSNGKIYTGNEWTPWELIEVGLIRQQVGGVGERFPGKPLTLEELIHGFTMESAYLMRREDIIGSLELGKRADLIVLDRDIFKVAKVNPTDIHNTKVLITLFNGDPVWGATNFEKVGLRRHDSIKYGEYGKGPCNFQVLFGRDGLLLIYNVPPNLMWPSSAPRYFLRVHS